MKTKSQSFAPACVRTLTKGNKFSTQPATLTLEAFWEEATANQDIEIFDFNTEHLQWETTPDWRKLRRLKKLRDLRICSHGNLSAIFSGIKSLSKLEKLSIHETLEAHTAGNDVIIDPGTLKDLPKSLRFLFLETRGFEHANLEGLSSNNLTELELMTKDCDQELVSHLPLGSLKSLSLSIRDARANAFTRFQQKDPPLECLTFEEACGEIENDCLEGIERFTNLREVSLSCFNLDDEQFLPISRLPKLESLELFSLVHIGPKSLIKLAECSTLKKISLDRICSISAGDLKEFKQKRPDVKVVVT